MKKYLTLMSVLGFGSITVTPVVACADQQQDSILKAISNGSDSYDGWEPTLTPVGITKPNNPPIEDQKPKDEQEISKTALQDKDSLAPLLAKLILDKTSNKDPVWFNSTLTVGTKCYDFTIDNGSDEKPGVKSWKVEADTGRISIDITYQFGVVSNDKTFKTEQYIKKTFNIKCDYTQSDYKVYSCVNDIVSQQTIAISVNEKTKPAIDSIYTDFSQETKTAIQEATNATIKNPFINSVTINIKGIDGESVKKITDKQSELKVNFVVSFRDSLIDMSLPSPFEKNKHYPPTVLQFNS